MDERAGQRQRWRTSPVRRRDWSNRRTVLIVCHTITSATRLYWIYLLLAADFQLDIVFTMAPDDYNAGVAAYLESRDLPQIGWDEATDRTFDLAIAASYGGIDQLRCALILLAHGAGYNKYSPVRPGAGLLVPEAADSVYGLGDRLVSSGRVIPTSLGLAHAEQHELLAELHPSAVTDSAHLVGDPAYDQIVNHLLFRDHYRRQFGIEDDQKLIVVTATWGDNWLLLQRPDIFDRMLGDLPAERYRVIAMFHPNIWATYTPTRLLDGLKSYLRRGLRVVPCDADWPVVTICADMIVGDHGSGTVYGAIPGVPLIVAMFSSQQIVPDSLAAQLAGIAPRLDGRSIRTQVEAAAAAYVPGLYEPVVRRITSVPGEFAGRLRRLVYAELGLEEIDVPACLPSLRVPRLFGES